MAQHKSLNLERDGKVNVIEMMAARLNEIYSTINKTPSEVRRFSTELSDIKCHPKFETEILPRAIEISIQKNESW